MKKIRIMSIIMGMLLLLVGCGSNTKKTSSEDKEKLTKIKIADLRSEFWLPVYIADKKGYFKEEGLDAEFVVFKDGPVAFQSTHAGEIDFCMLSAEPAIIGYDKGLESNLILATLYKKPYMLIGNKNIKTVEDLKGKKISAGTPGSGPYAFVETVLKEHNIDPSKDAELLNMDFAASLAALEKDEIQGNTVDSTRKELDTVKKSNILVDTANDDEHKKIYGSDRYESTIIVSSKNFVKKNPETVEKFSKAVLKGMEWQEKHTDKEVADLVADMFDGKLKKDELVKAIKGVRPFLSKDGYITKEGYDTMNNFCYDNGIIEKKVPYKDMVDMGILDKIKRETK